MALQLDQEHRKSTKPKKHKRSAQQKIQGRNIAETSSLLVEADVALDTTGV